MVPERAVGKARRQRERLAMPYTLSVDHFATEDEARTEIEALGWHPITIDLDGADSELHWHDFDAVLYVLDGSVTIELEDGTVMQCGAGARVETPSGVVHRDSSTAYRAVIGLAITPDEM